MSDGELLRAFEGATLGGDEWTHEAHLRVAWWYSAHMGVEEATDAMREGIKRLNAAHGVEATATGGYHETLTVVWVGVVWRLCGRAHHVDSGAFLAAYPELLDKGLPLRWYTRERLMSAEAREGFVPPDRAG